MQNLLFGFSKIFVALFLSFQLLQAGEWELVWADEFDQDGLPDSEFWSYAVGGHGWGNKELQYYTEGRLENAFVENGLLTITARKEAFEGNEYTSARMITRGKVDMMYGRIEVRAKLPDGLGTWPAIWMMPSHWSFEDGGWPDIGEIDIMEHVGYEIGVVHASAHSKDYQWQKGTQKTGTISIPDATKAFHTYVLEWSPDYLKAFVDDELFFEYQNEHLGVDKWPYDKPYYLIMNIAVGGAWGAAKGIDPEAFPQKLVVDYARYYKKK
jgi:beta-glucanase (GH16 family)